MSITQRKQRFMWDPLLHRAFVAATFDLGVKEASPKTLMDGMRALLEEGMPVELDDGQVYAGAHASLDGFGATGGPLYTAGLTTTPHGGLQHPTPPLQSIPPSVESLAVPGRTDLPGEMTTEHVKSHLQKFRANSKLSRDAFLRDYSRSLKEAKARAAHEEARTGRVEIPPGFSTYPVSMPAHLQASPAPVYRPDGSLLFPPPVDPQFAAKVARAAKRKGSAARARALEAKARAPKRGRSTSPPPTHEWPSGAPNADDVQLDLPVVGDCLPALEFTSSAVASLTGEGGKLLRECIVDSPQEGDSPREVDVGKLLDVLRSALSPPEGREGGPSLLDAARAVEQFLSLLHDAQSSQTEVESPVCVRVRVGDVRRSMCRVGMDTTSLDWALLPPGASGPVGPHHWRDPQWGAVQEGPEEDAAPAPPAPVPAPPAVLPPPTVASSIDSIEQLIAAKIDPRLLSPELATIVRRIETRQMAHRLMIEMQGTQAKKYSVAPPWTEMEQLPASGESAPKRARFNSAAAASVADSMDIHEASSRAEAFDHDSLFGFLADDSL
jgi:hypothetical protein